MSSSDALRIVPAELASSTIATISSARPAWDGGGGERIYSGGLSDLGRLFLTSGEAIAAAAYSGEELLEVDLEGGQDLVGVVLRPEPDLPFCFARVLDYLLGGALGLLVDLLVGDQ